jgi:signal transduction histidine kinase
MPPSRTKAPSAPGFSPFLTAGDRAYYELAFPLLARPQGNAGTPAAPGAATAARGYLIVRRQVSAAGAAEAVRGLLGGSITLQVGSSDGVWTDLSALTSGPPAGSPATGTADYRDATGDAQIGAGALVAGTPWRLWVALPRRVALAPADVLLQRIIPLSAIVVLLGSLVAWLAARRVTKPLNDLTAAAESIAGGDLSRRVDVSRRDEIGRLANAFNAMTVRVKDGYDRLDARVQDRTRDLEEAVAKLKEAQEALVRREKLAMLGQLASGVGHELRNPLGVMTNAVYFLEIVQPDAPPEVQEYHALLRAQIGLSEKIVSDLLDFARIKPPRREPLPLGRLIDDQLARVPVTEGVVVRRDLPDDLPRANVDPVQIGQVLLNLLVNAVQAMEQQGGVLTLRGSRDHDGVRLDVIDTGPGIAPELEDKIFEALFTTKARGIGLGLAVSRSLAEVNGGRLTVSSRPGAGATFTLTMPAVDVPAPAPQEVVR